MNYEFKFVSFDVKSLFTNVPLTEFFNFLRDEFSNYPFPIPLEDIIDLLKLCLCNLNFTFNHEFYEQKFGCAMGNPVSPIVSNLYMEFFEKKLLPAKLPSNVKWFRYVDDVLCLWPIEHNLEQLMVELNSLVPTIQFTHEIETENSLPFLDVKIIRESQRFKYKVYRKPTNICAYTHMYSNHAKNVKISTFSGMFLRALRICSPEFLNNEIDYIFGIGEKHKYPRQM